MRINIHMPDCIIVCYSTVLSTQRLSLTTISMKMKMNMITIVIYLTRKLGRSYRLGSRLITPRIFGNFEIKMTFMYLRYFKHNINMNAIRFQQGQNCNTWISETLRYSRWSVKSVIRTRTRTGNWRKCPEPEIFYCW